MEAVLEINNKRAELLAPAGSFECLKTALYFGADAVYVAGKTFGLRAFANNFSDDELKEATEYTHERGCKIYVTVNALVHNSQFEDLKGYLKTLSVIGVDGVIVSDPGVIQLIKEEGIGLSIHLSTQSSTFNYKSAAFWHSLGVKRIVLSRELTLDEIKGIIDNKPESLEIEVFVHGAMCVAHSGRCLLSYALTGRSGNKGECAQPCRWEYYLHEKGYEGQYFQITEDERGTYILNSKDLMMIEHIDKLIEAGIDSFKIEGRMKSPYYVASVVSSYRRAMDDYYSSEGDYVFDQSLKDELIKSASRQFSTGFFFGKPEQDLEKTLSGDREYTFVGIVINDAENGEVLVEQRNKFCVGDRLEILSPTIHDKYIDVEYIRNDDGEEQDSAPHPQQHIHINSDLPLKTGDILRKIR